MSKVNFLFFYHNHYYILNDMHHEKICSEMYCCTKFHANWSHDHNGVLGRHWSSNLAKLTLEPQRPFIFKLWPQTPHEWRYNILPFVPPPTPSTSAPKDFHRNTVHGTSTFDPRTEEHVCFHLVQACSCTLSTAAQRFFFPPKNYNEAILHLNKCRLVLFKLGVSVSTPLKPLYKF